MLQTYFATKASDSPLAPIVASCKRALRAIAITSGVVNVLTLTGSIFMMQVYDRVLGSQSLPTLWALSVLAIVAYLFQGWLETARSRMLTLIGEKVDAELGPAIQTAGLRAAVTTPTGIQDAIQVQRDLDAIRAFITGNGLIAAFDMPWILLYVVVASMLHPLFGLTAFLAASFLIWLTWKTEIKSKPLLKEANELSIKRNQQSDGIIRNSEGVVGNGMGANMARRLTALQTKSLEKHREATFAVAGFANVAKTTRMIIQSFVLGLGAYLAIKAQISSGAIIGASILVARALAPIDQAINSWRPFVAAREGHERLQKLIGRNPVRREPMALPLPKQSLFVRDLSVVAPGGQSFAVAGVGMDLKAGDTCAVIGQSASGKTSLFRALVGAWKLNRGQIQFDGTDPNQWSPDVLGKAIGYLPQDVQLFEGTIGENISRFDPEADPEKIRRAAEAAGLDMYIRQAFPQTGYNQPIAAGAANLSAGQRQRIGLARALYGDPFLVVLDEPNSNLDPAGEEALATAIKSVSDRKGIVIVSSHDHSILEVTNKVLALHQGQPEWFGPRDEVMRLWRERHDPKAPKPAGQSQPGPRLVQPSGQGAGVPTQRPVTRQIARPVAGPNVVPGSGQNGSSQNGAAQNGNGHATQGQPSNGHAHNANDQGATNGAANGSSNGHSPADRTEHDGAARPSARPDTPHPDAPDAQPAFAQWSTGRVTIRSKDTRSSTQTPPRPAKDKTPGEPS